MERISKKEKKAFLDKVALDLDEVDDPKEANGMIIEALNKAEMTGDFIAFLISEVTTSSAHFFWKGLRFGIVIGAVFTYLVISFLN